MSKPNHYLLVVTSSPPVFNGYVVKAEGRYVTYICINESNITTQTEKQISHKQQAAHYNGQRTTAIHRATIPPPP